MQPSQPGPLDPTRGQRTWSQSNVSPVIRSDDEETDAWKQLIDTVGRRRRIAGTVAAAVMLLTGVITAHQRIFSPIYEGSFTLMVKDPISSESKATGLETMAALATISQTALNRTSVDFPTLVELLKSPFLLKTVAERYGLDPAALGESITIKLGGDRKREAEGVIRVYLKGSDLQRERKLIDDLAQAYLDASLRQRQERLEEGIRFLDQQAPIMQRQSDEIQEQLAEFRRANRVMEPLVEAGALKEQSLSRANAIASLESDRNRLLQARNAIAEGTLTARSFQEQIGAGSSAGGGSSSGVGLEVTGIRQSQLEELAKLDEELADARSRYTPDSIVVQSLEARRAELAPNLRRDQLQAVDAALALNATRLSAARRENDQITTQLTSQPALIRQYQNLEQRLKLAQENYASFVQARELFKLEAAQRTVPWKLIAPPRMGAIPAEPSIPLNLAKGLLVAVAAGTAAALLRDRLDPVFHGTEEVRDALQQPVLGHVPFVKLFQGVREDQRFILSELDRLNQNTDKLEDRQKLEHFFYREAFRNLHTSLRFLNSDQPLRSIVITSSVPSEGKSLVNVLLAKTLAEMGKRVLLVDADLRKPQVHIRLGLNNLLGFSNLLTESDLPIEEALQPMPNYPTWKVLTAGRIPPDPTRLLSSDRIEHLVRQLEQSGDFDLIIYDTPPVLGLADAALMAQHCDGLAMLVSVGRVPRNLPGEAIRRVQSGGANVLGVVTNAIKPEHNNSSTYAYTSTAYAYYANPEEPGSSSQHPRKPNLNQRIRDSLHGVLRWIAS